MPTCAGVWAGWLKLRESYLHALALARQEPERRYLEKRLLELGQGKTSPDVEVDRQRSIKG